MRVSVEALDVEVGDEVLTVLDREVSRRIRSSMFAGVRDLRLRLRSAKGVLLCVAAVGFASGDLVTATGTSDRPLDAMLGALEGLPDRMDRVQRAEARVKAPVAMTDDAAVREELKRLLA